MDDLLLVLDCLRPAIFAKILRFVTCATMPLLSYIIICVRHANSRIAARMA